MNKIVMTLAFGKRREEDRDTVDLTIPRLLGATRPSKRNNSSSCMRSAAENRSTQS